MSEPRIKETYPGSGVTKSGARINPNMPDYGNCPFVIKKLAKAQASLEGYGIEFFLELNKKK